MLFCSDVYMDSAATVCYRTLMSQLPYDFLYVFDVFPSAYWRYYFAFVFACCRSAISPLGAYAAIAHRFPFATLSVGCLVGIISATCVVGCRSVVVCDYLCRCLSGDACEFDFDAECLSFHLRVLLCFEGVSHPRFARQQYRKNTQEPSETRSKSERI